MPHVHYSLLLSSKDKKEIKKTQNKKLLNMHQPCQLEFKMTENITPCTKNDIKQSLKYFTKKKKKLL